MTTDMSYEELLYTATFIVVILCWLGFAAAFVFRKRPTSSGEVKRNNKARAGIALEAGGYALVWTFRRKGFLLIDAWGTGAATAISAAAAILAVISVILVMSAVRRLGKQWAVAARVVEGHELITDGPYGIVRNPIYAGMFGMLIATGAAASHWWALLAACVLFWAGTLIRVNIEEHLLRETFGKQFDDYASRVSSIIPGVF